MQKALRTGITVSVGFKTLTLGEIINAISISLSSQSYAFYSLPQYHLLRFMGCFKSEGHFIVKTKQVKLDSKKAVSFHFS